MHGTGISSPAFEAEGNLAADGAGDPPAPEDFIYPMFVAPGSRVRQAVASMPGVCRLSVDLLVEEAEACPGAGVPAVLLFGLPVKEGRNRFRGRLSQGRGAAGDRELKKKVPELMVITDVCLCEYTSHGHCGMLAGEEVDNDATLEVLAQAALSHAEAGADMVAPSDMMDGRVGAIRAALDERGFQRCPSCPTR